MSESTLARPLFPHLAAALAALPVAPGVRWWEQEPYTPPWPVACAATEATAGTEGSAHLAAAFALTLAAWPGLPTAECPSLEKALAMAVGRGHITATMARSYLAQIIAETVQPVRLLEPLAHTVQVLWTHGIGVAPEGLAREAVALVDEDPFTRSGRRDLARRVHGALGWQ